MPAKKGTVYSAPFFIERKGVDAALDARYRSFEEILLRESPVPLPGLPAEVTSDRMNTQELFDLSGQVAIVTGGGTGLGRQLADGLAEMGADLVLGSRREDRCRQAAEQLELKGIRALARACDVTRPDEIAALVEFTRGAFGKIDILVNNAGTAWGAAAEEMPLERWNQVIQTNLTGTFLCAQAAGRVMIEQGRGKIINMASVAAFSGSDPEIMQASGYHASKGGVATLTRDLASGWARHNIQVNAIAPGWFPTHLSGWIIENRRERLISAIPMGRVGGEDDLKGAAVFLASRASDYVTGHVLVVDGGLMAR